MHKLVQIKSLFLYVEYVTIYKEKTFGWFPYVENKRRGQ